MKTVSCPNVIMECATHCWHHVPHDRVDMCQHGRCPVTHHWCECSETPVKVNVREHNREDGSLKWID